MLYTTPKQSAKRQRICLGRGIPGFLLSHCCLGTLIYHRDLDQYIWRSFWSFKSRYIDHWIRSYGDKLHRRSDFSFWKLGFRFNNLDFSGLLGSLLCKHYGNRKVIMVGALIGTLGFCLSFYAPTIEYLFFTFSLMIGSGLGITFVPAVEIINEYFDTRKTIAFGLSLSGVGCGMLVYPPLNK